MFVNPGCTHGSLVIARLWIKGRAWRTYGSTMKRFLCAPAWERQKRQALRGPGEAETGHPFCTPVRRPGHRSNQGVSRPSRGGPGTVDRAQASERRKLNDGAKK